MPSGGPGPSGGSGGSGSSGRSGGGTGSSNPQGIVSSALVTSSSRKTFQLGATLAALSQGGMSISQLFSGYPIAPGGGPALQGNLVVLSDPSSVAWSMQNSTVAVVPILLTTAPGSGSQSYTLVLLDTTTGMTYSVAVNVLPAPTTSSGGPSTTPTP